MTITLPDDMREQAERQARAAGFATVEEYMADLVREDGEQYPDTGPTPGRSFSTREELERLLDETIGQPVRTMDEAFWKRLDERIAAKATERGKTA